MNTKPALLSLVLGAALLVPAAARADDDRDEWRRRDARVSVHVHTRDCNDAPRPPAGDPQYASGHYELRTVNQWVPGYSERVWVEGSCRTKHKRHGSVTRCRDGYYDERWVDGHYEQRQDWVWVADARPAPRPRPGITVTARF